MAKEIQDSKPAMDRFTSPYKDYVMIHCCDGSLFKPYQSGDENDPESYKRVWLPRQDQLQAMCVSKSKPEHENAALFFLDNLFLFIKECCDRNEMLKFYPLADKITFDSVEQWMLGLVMKDVYKKQWSRERNQWIESVGELPKEIVTLLPHQKIVDKTPEDILREKNINCERCRKQKAVYYCGDRMDVAVCEGCYMEISMY